MYKKCCFRYFQCKALALAVILRCVSPMSDFSLRSYERFKKKKFYLTESQLLNYCNSTSLLPPGSSFMPQVSLPCFLQKTSETMMEKLVSLRPLWISPKEEILSGALLETAAVGLPSFSHRFNTSRPRPPESSTAQACRPTNSSRYH